MRGEWSFEPEEIWSSVTNEAKDFVSRLLRTDAAQRMTAIEALGHPWMLGKRLPLQALCSPQF